MKVTLTLGPDGPYHLIGRNDSGNTVTFDGSPDMGGLNLGARPMQTMLMSIGACSAIDMLSILGKQRQPVEAFEMELEGERTAGAVPAPFTAIRFIYKVTGAVEREKAVRAAELSMEKYCSAVASLDPGIRISWDVVIVHGA